MEALLGRQLGLATLTLPTEAGCRFPSSSDPIAVEMGGPEVVAALRAGLGCPPSSARARGRQRRRVRGFAVGRGRFPLGGGNDGQEGARAG